MKELIELARLGVAAMLKADDNAIVGRTPTAEAAPSASPGVPAEEPQMEEELESEARPLEAVLQDAIRVLEDGLRAQEGVAPEPTEEGEHSVEEEALTPAEAQEIQFAMRFLRKGDIPISVKAIIKDAEGRVLVLRDAEGPWWDLPGGHVREGEPLDEALKREVQEETGLDVLTSSQTETRMLNLGGEMRPVLFYQAECQEGQPRCSTEHIGYQWAGDEDLKGLNLGVFKDVLIPGAKVNENVELGDPATARKMAKEAGAGIAGPGDGVTGADVHTPAVGGGRKRTAKASAGSQESHLRKITPSGDQLVTGAETEIPEQGDQQEYRSNGNQLMRSASGLRLIKSLGVRRSAGTDMLVLSKAVGRPFVIAGYASPVVVDQEGHRISHEALARDLPRFMAEGGRWAQIQVMHSNLTAGRIIPEFQASNGRTYKTQVDDVGLYVVAELRTDPNAPGVIQKVIAEIESGDIRSFSISGNADNPVFTCDKERCYYSINEVNLFEVSLCPEGVNPDAKFDIISRP